MQSVRLTVDLSAIRKNFRVLRSLLGPAVAIMGVVKSDAYGHGILRVARVLEDEGAEYLAVAYLEEAIVLRNGGIKAPLVILCGLTGRGEFQEAVERGLIPVLYDLEAIAELSSAAQRIGRQASFQLKIDTGMGRLGISPDDVARFIEVIKQSRGLRLQALMSHLSSAEDPDGHFTMFQLDRFEDALNIAGSSGLDLSCSSIANSAGVLLHPETRLAMVRPGILLYGYGPVRADAMKDILPAMRFTGRILQTKLLEKGSPVSYERTYYTSSPKRIAITTGGYGEGLMRAMSNKAGALIGGRKVPVIGAVCMNMTICDITELPVIPAAGDEVVFIGAQGEEKITAEDLAKWSSTISYEILCSIGQRHKKEYLDEKADHLYPE